MEIDLRINQIKPSIPQQPAQEVKVLNTTPVPAKEEPSQAASSQPPANKEKPAKERPKNKAEERLEAIREEVLKAMERLEQIETEG